MTGIYNRIGPELTPVVRILLILNGSIFAVQLLLSWTVGDYLTLYFGMTSDMITLPFFYLAISDIRIPTLRSEFLSHLIQYVFSLDVWFGFRKLLG